MGQNCEYAVVYRAALTVANLSYDADRTVGLHDGNARRARGGGPRANAVPGIGAAAQRGLRGLEAGDESTGIGALRIIYSFLLGREGDGRVRK